MRCTCNSTKLPHFAHPQWLSLISLGTCTCICVLGLCLASIHVFWLCLFPLYPHVSARLLSSGCVLWLAPHVYKPFGFHVLESSSHSLFSKSITQYPTWLLNLYIAPVLTLVLRSHATSPNWLLTPLTPFVYVFPLGRHTFTTRTNPTMHWC